MKIITASFSLLLALFLMQDAQASGTALQAPSGANVRALFQSNMQQGSSWVRDRGLRCSDDDMSAELEAIREEMKMKIQMLTEELEQALSNPNLSGSAIAQIIEEFKQKMMMIKEEYEEKLEQAGMINDGRITRCGGTSGAGGVDANDSEERRIVQDFKNQAKAYFLEARTELNNPNLSLDEMDAILENYEMKMNQLFASFDNASFLQQHYDMYIQAMRDYHERLVDAYTNGGGSQNGGSHQGGVRLIDQL